MSSRLYNADTAEEIGIATTEQIAASEPVKCAECGHLHYFPLLKAYGTCPLLSEGCDCRGQ